MRLTVHAFCVCVLGCCLNKAHVSARCLRTCTRIRTHTQTHTDIVSSFYVYKSNGKTHADAVIHTHTRGHTHTHRIHASRMSLPPTEVAGPVGPGDVEACLGPASVAPDSGGMVVVRQWLAWLFDPAGAAPTCPAKQCFACAASALWPLSGSGLARTTTVGPSRKQRLNP